MDRTPRIRLASPERRISLVDAARHEFARSGFHGASTARIAATAGCSEPMLYKHFRNKQALFVAVLDEVGEAMESQIDLVLDQPGDPFDHWYGALPVLFANPAYAEMVSMRTLAITVSDIPEVASALVAANDRLLARATSAVERAQELGSVAPSMTGDYVAWIWLGITMVAASRMRSEGAPDMCAALPHAERFVGSLRPVGTT